MKNVFYIVTTCNVAIIKVTSKGGIDMSYIIMIIISLLVLVGTIYYVVKHENKLVKVGASLFALLVTFEVVLTAFYGLV